MGVEAACDSRLGPVNEKGAAYCERDVAQRFQRDQLPAFVAFDLQVDQSALAK